MLSKWFSYFSDRDMDAISRPRDPAPVISERRHEA
jgi:hypothetical protein